MQLNDSCESAETEAEARSARARIPDRKTLLRIGSLLSLDGQ
jgi:hypothetical protein